MESISLQQFHELITSAQQTGVIIEQLTKYIKAVDPAKCLDYQCRSNIRDLKLTMFSLAKAADTLWMKADCLNQAILHEEANVVHARQLSLEAESKEHFRAIMAEIRAIAAREL